MGVQGERFYKCFIRCILVWFFISGAAFWCLKQKTTDAFCQFSLTVPILLSTTGDNKR